MRRRVTSGELDSRLLLGATLANDAATVDIARRLRESGVRTIALKGPSFRNWLYDGDEFRVSADVDLLLCGDDLGRAEAVLAARDYRCLGEDVLGRGRPHHRIWEAPSGTLVELHRSIVGVGAPEGEAWSVLSSGTEEFVVPERGPIEVLGVPARLLHVALHAAQHGAEVEKTREDLRRALSRASDGAWRQAATLANRLDAEQAFAAGLSLVLEGRAMLERLGLPNSSSATIRLRARSAPAMGEGVAWLLNLPGLREKFMFVARQIVPPPGYMRIWFPRARRQIAWLAVAYLWRPFWLALHLGPAVTAWARARRGSEPR